MRVGVPREIKPDEYRVGLTPTAVREYAARDHEVVVETGAGDGAGYPDAAFVRAGAKILPDAESVFREAPMIVMVKEPQPV
jgi:alanine dehydrogenase